jgi:hypothetical protein
MAEKYGSKFTDLLFYIAWIVDDSGNGRRSGSDACQEVDSSTVLVCYQSGFEPSIVAVKGFFEDDPDQLSDSEAEELAQEYLLAIGWLTEPKACDSIIRSYE